MKWGVIATKGYSIFPKFPELEPCHQIQISVVHFWRWLNLTPLQRIQSVFSRRLGVYITEVFWESVFTKESQRFVRDPSHYLTKASLFEVSITWHEAFGLTTWHSCRVVIFVFVNLAPGGYSPRLYLLYSFGFIARRLKRPKRRMPTGLGIFCNCRAFVRSLHYKVALCCILAGWEVGYIPLQYQQPLTFYCQCLLLLFPTVLSFGLCVSRYVWSGWIGWLIVWVLWHINLCRLFNTKFIFMKIVLFQTIQFIISTQFKCKYSLIVKNISILSYSV